MSKPMDRATQIVRAASQNALCAVALCAIAHMADTGACEYADHETGYCDADECTYCALARVCDALPKARRGDG